MRVATSFLFVLILGIISTVLAQRKPRPSDSYYQTKARKYHEEAIQRANQNDYRLALALFRATVRLDPKVTNYWNDLGVTEMRMGQLLKAKDRFFRALQIDSNNQFAIDNLRELAEFLKEDAHEYFKKNGQLQQFKASRQQANRRKLRDQRQHTIMEPRIFTKDEFLTILEEKNNNGIKNQSFTAKQRDLFSYPFVVRDYLSVDDIDDEKVLQYFQIDQLQYKYGKQRVDYYPQNMREESSKPFFNTFEQAVDDLMSIPEGYFADVDASEAGTYIQWNLDAALYRKILNEAQLELPRFFDIAEDMNVFSCLGSQYSNNNEIVIDDMFKMLSEFYLKVHWKMLLIGEQNAGMFFHQDILQASAWQLLLSGQKKWHVCPGKIRKEDDKEDQSELSRSESLNDLYYKAGDIDMFDYHLNYQKFPKLKKASCYETIIYPGDFFYYPGDYWHQTLNEMKPTIALSSSVLFSKYDFEVITKELRQECYGNARIFQPNSLLCSRLEKCFEVWGTSNIGVEGEEAEEDNNDNWDDQDDDHEDKDEEGDGEAEHDEF